VRLDSRLSRMVVVPLSVPPASLRLACRAVLHVEGGGVDVDVDTFRVANEGRANGQGVSGFEGASRRLALMCLGLDKSCQGAPLTLFSRDTSSSSHPPSSSSLVAGTG